jgi:hypothetical protein
MLFQVGLDRIRCGIPRPAASHDHTRRGQNLRFLRGFAEYCGSLENPKSEILNPVREGDEPTILRFMTSTSVPESPLLPKDPGFIRGSGSSVCTRIKAGSGGLVASL